MNDQFLAGKSALVTGGTRGIGYSIAEALARHGAGVAICGRSAETAAKAAADLAAETGAKVVGYGCDLRASAEVEAFYGAAAGEFGKLDIAINNAGIGIFKPMAELTDEDWEKTLTTNLSGVFYSSRAAVRHFRENGGGYLFQISSLAGRNPFAGGSAYNASKFGLNGFTEALMLDHRHDGVRVTNICPGSVDTDFTPRGGQRAAWKIQPEDIADVVVSLLRLPERTLVSLVEMRPSRPPRK